MSGQQRIYLDHAATSWPKPDAVLDAADRFARECGAAAGRGGYRSAIDAGHVIESLRRGIAERIGAESPKCVSFHASGTAALNAAIHGVVREGDHLVVTAAEHNSVLRPLQTLVRHRGVRLTVVPCDSAGRVEAEAVLSEIRDDTRLVAVTHASNVTGAIQPIAAIGQGLREHPAAFLCDAAQTFGYLPIDVLAMGIDLLATPGHKGGQAPFGTGLLYVNESWHQEIVATIQGGTGSDSESLDMPSAMPTKLEPGIANVPALAGWLESLNGFRDATEPAAMRHRETLHAQLRAGLAAIDGVRLFGDGSQNRVGGNSELPEPSTGAASLSLPGSLPIVSFRVEGLSPGDLASILDAEFGIEVRAGLHCAALIHPLLGSDPEGTVRVSAGHPTKASELQTLIEAISEISSGMSEGLLQ